MQEFKFRKFDQIILFGGGDALCHVALSLKLKGINVLVISSKRHLSAALPQFEDYFDRFLHKNNIQYLQVQDTDSLNSKIFDADYSKSIGISFGFSKIFKQSFIDKFEGNLLNAHGSPLPKHRGGGGFSWRIMQGGRHRDGICLLHQIDGGIDTGNLVYGSNQKLFSETYLTDSFRNPLQFEEKHAECYNKLVCNFIDLVSQNSTFYLVSQEGSPVYWPRLSTETHGWIDWSWDAEDIIKFIEAFSDPYYGSKTYCSDNIIYIKSARCLGVEYFHPFQYGIIFNKTDHTLCVAAKNRAIAINGYDGNVKLGDRLYTPKDLLEDAMMTRVIYK